VRRVILTGRGGAGGLIRRAVTHVGHLKVSDFVERGNGRRGAVSHRKRAARETCTVHRLRKDRERFRAAGLDDYVERFGRGESELLDHDRLDVLAISGDKRHREARDPHVEDAHG
jgi:hypothetical protein